MSKYEPSSERRLGGGPNEGLPDEQFLQDTTRARTLPNVDDDTQAPGDERWLNMARRCYSTSTTFFDAAMRRKLDDAQSLFRSEHPAGSKYYTDAFKKRSHVFRPKTRAMVRKHEAALALALFGTADVATCNAPNQDDRDQVLSAKIQQELFNRRIKLPINKGGFPFFAIAVGAYQDAARNGFVVARTGWDYRESKRYFNRKSGANEIGREEEVYTSRDQPFAKLIPPENLRIDPACDWLDPINSSPYIIELMPMYVCDIRERMNNPKLAQGVRYRKLDTATLLAGMRHSFDTIRQRREGNRQDRYEPTQQLQDYSICWVHRHIMRIDGEDYYFETVGLSTLLTDPVPLAEIELRGYRPYVWGYVNYEAHNPLPDGPVTLARPLQEETNDLANMRMDANKMSTFGRHLVRRGANVDMDALARFSPASAIEVSNINSDVKWDKAQPPDRQVFDENNLMQQELDDLFGNFSSSSVLAGRQREITVGGMEMMQQPANILNEYEIRTLGESFFVGLVTQIIDVIKLWESDTAIAAVVGQKFGVGAKRVFRALETEASVIVNIGFGQTSPMQRIQRLRMGLGTVAEMFPDEMVTADRGAIVGEVFGALGYADGLRFFPGMAGKDEDPMVTQLKRQVQQLTQMVQGKQMDIEGRVKIATIQAKASVMIQQLRGQSAQQLMLAGQKFDLFIEQLKIEVSKIELALEREKNDIARNQLYMQREALSHTISMAEREFALEVQTVTQAPAPHPILPPAPAGTRMLIQRLTQPGSGAARSSASTASLERSFGGGETAQLPGVVARGHYGMIPGEEG